MKTNNLAYLHRDRGYRFNEPGSLLYQVRIVINNAGLSSRAIAERVYDKTGEPMKPRTIDRLMNGETQKPLFRTVELIMAALGKRMTWR
jgi:hypothetical protein